MLFLSRSHCGSRCSVFISTDRIYCSHARLSGGLPGWWNISSSLETHCLSLPHWKMFFFFFWVLLFQLVLHLCPNPSISSGPCLHRLWVSSLTNTEDSFEVQTWQEQEERWGGIKPLPMWPNTPQYWSESKLRVKERVGRLRMSNGHMDD